MQIVNLAAYGCKAVIADRKRSLWVVLGLALGVGLYVAISVMAAGYAKLVALPFSQLNTDLIIQRAVKGGQGVQSSRQASIRLPFSNQAISGAEIKAVQGLDSIENVSLAMILWNQAKNDFSVIAGVELDASGGPATVMSWIDKGKKIEKSGEVVVESHYAKFHKIRVGSQVDFGEHHFSVVGISKIKQGASVAAANYYITLDDARALAKMDGSSANMLFAKLKKGVEPEDVQQKLPGIIPGVFASTADNIGSMLKGFAKISNTVSWLLGTATLGFAVLLSSWLIAGSLHERSWQIGLMKTVGWQKKDILATVAAETVMLGFVGGICGLGLGYMAAVGLSYQEVSLTLPWNLSVQPGTAGHNGSGQTVALPVVMQFQTGLTALVIATFSAILTGIVVAGKLADGKVKKVFGHI
ncbi:MAG: ABC transporter permease [Desulfobulbaceae bacterium]|uniref:ABC transporter permease n=1 Tax=Candidatus Desulfobia pelagia TaxID=2841692 RepID=A0A8J6NDA0_9BACT|nr:ABC transporter permease [Candidatus Desulfobia pelagia]